MREEKSIAELLQLGNMGLELGRSQRAEDYFDLVLERAPGHPRALLGKAKACQDPREALELVRQVLSLRPASREARRLKEELEERVGRPAIIQRPSSVYKGRGTTSSPLGREMYEYSIPSERLEESSQPSLAQRLAHMARGLFIAGMDKEMRRRLVAGYAIASLIVGGFIMAILYARLLPLFDDRGTMGTLQQLSYSKKPTAKIAFPSQTVGPSLLEQAERATVLIIVPDPIFRDVSRGSGCIISPKGLVITNYHVLTREMGGNLANEGGLAFVGLTKDVRKSPSAWYIACLVASDKSRDLAVLQILRNSRGRRITALSFPQMPLGNSDTLELGQMLMGLGYPSLGGDTLTLTRGSMAGFSSSQGGLHLGKTDSELLPGSSGGAVLDDSGRLVGVITAAHTDQRTQGRLSYFVLLDEAKDVIREARAAPYPTPQIDWMIDVFDQLVD